MIDLHSHILPGIDDGARNFDESIEIIRELHSHGIRGVVATPHYIKETKFIFPIVDNKAILEELKKGLKAKRIDMDLYLGNEIYIDKDIMKLIANGEISPLADSRFLLIELPLDEEFPNYDDYLSNLIANGYEVVLAHPERYLIAQENYSVLDDLHELGVLFQCNFGSIGGKYGKSAQKLVKKLAKDKKIFAFGSDSHRVGGGRYIDYALKKLLKYYSEEELKELLVENPKRIVS